MIAFTLWAIVYTFLLLCLFIVVVLLIQPEDFFDNLETIRYRWEELRGDNK